MSQTSEVESEKTHVTCESSTQNSDFVSTTSDFGSYRDISGKNLRRSGLPRYHEPMELLELPRPRYYASRTRTDSDGSDSVFSGGSDFKETSSKAGNEEKEPIPQIRIEQENATNFGPRDIIRNQGFRSYSTELFHARKLSLLQQQKNDFRPRTRSELNDAMITMDSAEFSSNGGPFVAMGTKRTPSSKGEQRLRDLNDIRLDSTEASGFVYYKTSASRGAAQTEGAHAGKSRFQIRNRFNNHRPQIWPFWLRILLVILFFLLASLLVIPICLGGIVFLHSTESMCA